MKQILAILGDAEQAKLLSWLCAEGGVQAHLSEGALPALTDLERTPVDAVVCSQDAGDMSGEEFRNIVRYEPATRLIPFYLLWETLPEHPGVPPNYDLPASQTLLQTMEQLLAQLDAQPPKGSRLLRARPGDGDLSGNFEGVTLGELLGWLAEMEATGHWLVWDSEGHPIAHLLIQRGDVIYAEYGQWYGNPAMLELLDTAHLYPQTRFSFLQQPLPEGPVPRNIAERTERMLMEVMVDFDHRQAGRQGIDITQAS